MKLFPCVPSSSVAAVVRGMGKKEVSVHGFCLRSISAKVSGHPQRKLIALFPCFSATMWTAQSVFLRTCKTTLDREKRGKEIPVQCFDVAILDFPLILFEHAKQHWVEGMWENKAQVLCFCSSWDWSFQSILRMGIFYTLSRVFTVHSCWV